MKNILSIILALFISTAAIAETDSLKPKPMEPCKAGTEPYFVVFSFQEKSSGKTGNGNTFSCVDTGKMEDRNGIADFQYKLATNPQKTMVIITFFQKLKQ